MFVYFLLLLNVLLPFFAFSSFSDKKRIIVPLAEAISVFLCLYSVTSGIMWMCALFSIELSLLLVTILDLIIFTVRYLRSEVKGIEFFRIKSFRMDYRVLLNRIVIFVAVVLSIGAYSTLRIGFNDGNAQTQAISILNGNNSRVFEVDEYQNIQPESVYEVYFFDTVKNIDIENFTANYWISNSEKEEGKTYRMMGEFGCNPVYPSILALSASVFGTSRMAFIQAVFAFCMFVFVDEILKALKCDWKLRSVLILLLGVSPIIVYSNHTTLIEPIIGFCMVLFTYFLICKDNKLQMLSAVGVVTFAFIHTSVYTMIPLFLILYWMLFIQSGKYRHLISSGIAVFGYVLSFVFLYTFAYKNTSINYRLGMPFFGKYFYLFVVLVVALTIVITTTLIVLTKKIQSEKFINYKKTKGKRIFKIMVAGISIVPIAVAIFTVILDCYSFGDFLKITIISFAVCSGVILIPFILVKLVSARYELGIKEAVIIILYIYTIIIYSSVMKVMIDGYYYDARYLSSFIPFIILAAGMMLRLLKKEEKYFIPVISIIILAIPYTASLLSSNVETRLDREIYDSVVESVETFSDDNTVILIEKNLMKDYYYPLASLSNANVYPIEADYFDSFCFDTSDYSSKVLYITDEKGDNYSERGTTIFAKYNEEYCVNEDNKSKILGLPNEFCERIAGKVQIISFDALYKLLDYEQYEKLTLDKMELTVDNVNIDNNVAYVTVSLTDKTQLIFNDKYSISYHLEFDDESENIYDNPRTDTGALIFGDYTLTFDLSKQKDNMNVIIDVVEEDVEWYSWSHDVPEIVFTEEDEGWEYSIKTRETEQIP